MQILNFVILLFCIKSREYKTTSRFFVSISFTQNCLKNKTEILKFVRAASRDFTQKLIPRG